ncbi:MAG: hypothetical protein ACK5MZ_01170 [Aestuariibaculum sp.]
MNKKIISFVLVLFILLTSVLSIIVRLSDSELLAGQFSALVFPFTTLIYFLNVKNRSFYMMAFFVIYSIADLLVFVIENISEDLRYYLGNFLYLTAYTAIVIEVTKQVNFKRLFKHFKVHLVVLILLSVYLVIVFQKIIEPHLIVDTDYYVEISYNIVLMVLLTLSFLNYLVSNNNKRTLFLFLGVFFLFFCELIMLTYIYVLPKGILHNISIILYVSSCYFFIWQAKLNDSRLSVKDVA